MAVDSRQKGARGEYVARDLLKQYSGLEWERVPASGALSYLKGDIYLPHADNRFCIEVKNYEESIFDIKVLTNRSSKFKVFWDKVIEQAAERDQEPLLLFKHNRSKFYISTKIKPVFTDKFMRLKWLDCYVLLLEDWLNSEEIDWTR